MANTLRTYQSDGARVLYPIDFENGFIRREHVFVYLDTESDWTQEVTYTWVNDTQIQLTSPVTTGLSFVIRRIVPRDAAVNDYADGAVLKEENLDDSYNQALHILEEIQDGYLLGPTQMLTIVGDGINVNVGDNFLWTGNHDFSGASTTINGNNIIHMGNVTEALTPINAQTGTSYIFVLTDRGSIVTMDNVAANTIEVPAEADVFFPIGTTLTVRMKGAGQTTLVAAAGVTIAVPVLKGLKIAATGEWASLVKEDTNYWSISGGIVS